MAADYLQRALQSIRCVPSTKGEALLGDVFYPAVKVEEKNVTSTFQAEDGKPYAIVEFTAK